MKSTLIPALVVLALAGCASNILEPKKAVIKDNVKEVEKSLASMKTPPPSFVVFNKGSYVPFRKIEKPEFNKAQMQTLATEIEVNRTFQNLNEVSSWLSSIINAPVYLNPELMVAPTQTNPLMGGLPGNGMPGMPGQGQQIQPQAQGGTGALNPAMRSFTVNYSGRIGGFLDIVAAQYGIFFKLEASSIRFLLTDSRTFRIKALPGDTQLASTVSSSSNTTGSGSGSSSTANGASNNSAGVSFAALSVWTGIESAIKQMLTTTTGKVAVSPATGTLTVTDTPRVLERVAEFINEQNISLSRQVAVNVRVLSVAISDSDEYGINWNAVYNNLSDNAAFKMSTAFTPVSDAANFVLQTSSPSSNNWGAASGAIITALSKQGNVSELTSATMVTLNNQPAPVNVGRQISYLASSATTQTANVGATTTLTPGQIQTGFSMVVLPHIIDGQELLIQTSINLSSLLQLTTVTSGTASIQSPDLATSNFIQKVRMMSGNVLVVAGFDQDNLSAVASGVGSATSPLIGLKKGAANRNMLVVLIQPTVAI